MSKTTKQLTLTLLFIFATFVLWTAFHKARIVPSFILPSPVRVVARTIEDYHILVPNALHTFGIALLGLFLSLCCAFIGAIVLDISSAAHAIFYPFILLFQMVPIILFAPLLVLLFGYGMFTKLLVVVLMCFFPILVSMLQGFRFVSVEHISLLKTMGAATWQIYFWVKIPSALTELFSGLRIAVSYAITASIISEWVGSIQGLGFVMIQSQRSFIVERVYAIIGIILLMSTALYGLLLLVERVCLPQKSKGKIIFS